MENWKAGEVHGAFVLKTDFKRVDQTVLTGMTHALAWILPVAVLIGVGLSLCYLANGWNIGAEGQLYAGALAAVVLGATAWMTGAEPPGE